MATAKAKGKTVAAKKATEVAVPSALKAKMAAVAGAGFEEATRDAFAVPFIRILQDLSPQVKKKMVGYIEGAKPGQFFNTVSQEVSDTLRVVPCHYSQSFIEWTPRDEKEGQGLVAVHLPGDPIITRVARVKGKPLLPNGNLLMDTRSHFVLIIKDDGTTEGALIALSSTGIKVSRRWMSQMKSTTIDRADGSRIPAPMCAYSYALTSEEEANEQGSWHQWVVSDRELVTEEHIFDAALAFAAQMKVSASRVNYSEAAPTASHADTPGDLDNEINA